MNKNLKYILSHLQQLKGHVVLLLVLAMLTSGLTLIPPYLTKVLFDKGILQGSQSVILQFGMYLILIYILQFFVNVTSGYTFTTASNRFITSIKTDLFRRIMRMPLSFFDEKQSGYILGRINEVDSLAIMFSPMFFNLIPQFISFIAAIVIVASYSPLVLLVAFMFMPIFYYLTNNTGKTIRKSTKDLFETSASARAVFQESIGGIMELKGMNAEKNKNAQINMYLKNLKDKSIQRGKMMSKGTEMVSVMTNISSGALVIVLGMLIVKGKLSIGDYLALTQYVSMLYMPARMIGSLGITIQPAFASLSRLGFVYDMKTEDELTGDTEVQKINNISFHDVTFSYSNSERPVLDRFNLEIKVADKIALLGPNGSGKSTIVKLILGFYTDYSGEIKISDTELRMFNLESLRKRIGIVSQKIFLFTGTIFENLQIANPRATREQIHSALEMSGFDIETFPPESFCIMEGGKNLSGGQIQKLAIARMIIRDADLLIFDEATANLDTESKGILKRAIQTVFCDKICIIITHDQEIAECAGRILDLSKVSE